MTTATLLEKDRRSLAGHRVRGLPSFWLGFLSVGLSLFGLMARQREIPEIRSFARRFLEILPGDATRLSGILHFQFSPPFATFATFLGLALMIWGWAELLAASRIKRELAAAEDLKRQQQIAQEMSLEEESPAHPRSG